MLAGGGDLVAPDDPRGMAMAIEHVVGLGGPEWVRMSDRALETARRYDLETSAGLFEEALRTAIERQKQGVVT